MPTISSLFTSQLPPGQLQRQEVASEMEDLRDDRVDQRQRFSGWIPYCSESINHLSQRFMRSAADLDLLTGLSSSLSLHRTGIAHTGRHYLGAIPLAVFGLSNSFFRSMTEIVLPMCDLLLESTFSPSLLTKAGLRAHLEQHPGLKELMLCNYQDVTLPSFPQSLKELCLVDCNYFCDTSTIPSHIEVLKIKKCSSLQEIDLSHLSQLSKLSLEVPSNHRYLRLHRNSPLYKSIIKTLYSQIKRVQVRFSSSSTDFNVREKLFSHLQLSTKLPISFFARTLLFNLCFSEDPSIESQKQFFAFSDVDEWVTRSLSLCYLGNNCAALRAFMIKAIPYAIEHESFRNHLHCEVRSALTSCSDRLDLSFFEISRGMSVYCCIEAIKKGPMRCSPVGDEGIDVLFYNLFAKEYVEEKVLDYSIRLVSRGGNDSIGGMHVYSEELSLYVQAAPSILKKIPTNAIAKFTEHYYYPSKYFNLGFKADEEREAFISKTVKELNLQCRIGMGDETEQEMKGKFMKFLLDRLERNKLLSDLFFTLKERGYFKKIMPFAQYYNQMSESGQLEELPIGEEVAFCRGKYKKYEHSLSERDFPFLAQETLFESYSGSAVQELLRLVGVV